MMKSAKIIIFTLLFTLLFGFSTHKTFAFSSGEYFSYMLNYWKAIDSPEMNLQSFVNETFKGLGGSIVNFVAGCPTCTSKSSSNFGLLGDISNTVPFFYTSLPSSSDYFTDIGQRLNLISPVYAQNQGLGFAALNSFLPAWKIFRNISYSFIVIISIFIGFAIMFRVKLSPQASVTIQSAVPKIIIALILITFSYAIVGFLVDIMFVVSNLILALFTNYLPYKPDGFPITDNWDLIVAMLKMGLNALIFPFLIMALITGTGAIFAGTGIGGLVLLGGLAGIVIFAIVLLIAFIRILFMLAKSYVNVVLSLIFAPIILLAGAIPSMNTVGSWFQGIISNLLIFPVVLTLTCVAGLIAKTGAGALFSPLAQFLNDHSWPDLVKEVGPFFANGQNAPVDGFLLLFIAPGILLLTPKAGDIVQSFISKKPFAYGTAMGESLSGGNVGKSALQYGSSYEKGRYDKEERQIQAGSLNDHGSVSTQLHRLNEILKQLKQVQ